jgi:hypothetical protein
MYQYQTDYILQKEQELDQATSEIETLRARAAQNEAEKARHQINMMICYVPWSFKLSKLRNT